MDRGAALAAAALALSSVAAWAQTPPAATLTLLEAEHEAQLNSPLLRQAQAQTGYASAVVQERRADYLPTLTASATVVGAKDDGIAGHGSGGTAVQPRITAGALNVPTVLDRAAGGIALTQLITDFGRTDHLVESAKASLRAARSAYEDTRQHLFLLVTQGYFATLAAESAVGVAQRALQDRQTTAEQVQLLAKNQLRSGLDAAFADVSVEQARLLMLQAQEHMQIAQVGLGEMLGRPSAVQEKLVDDDGSAVSPPPATLEPLLGVARAQRPELERERERVEAARQFTRAQRDLSLPVISVAGAAGLTPTGDGRLPDKYAAGGVNVSIPLFTGGRLNAQAAEAQQRQLEAEAQLQAADLEVGREVQDAWWRSRSEFDALDAAQRLQAAAAQALDLARARYLRGLSSVVELDSAQLNALEADLRLVQSRYDYRLALAELAYAQGVLAGP